MTTETTAIVPGSCKHGTAPSKWIGGCAVVTCVECKWEREDRERARVAAVEEKRASERRSLTGDEVRMNSRFASDCAVCGRRIERGAVIAYSRSQRAARHINCASGGTSVPYCATCGRTAAEAGETVAPDFFGRWLCESCNG